MADLRTKPRGTAGLKPVLLLLAAASFALAACGGGSGGVVTESAVPENPVLENPVPEVPVPEEPVSEGGSPADAIAGLRAGGHFAAAGATPIAGSVTQSSDRRGSVTAHPVTVTIAAADGMLAPTVGGRGWGFEGLRDDEIVRSDATIIGEPWQAMEATRRYDDRSARVVHVLTDAGPTDFDREGFNDYLVMGIWSRIPAKWLDENGELADLDDSDLAEFYSDIEAGVFADGGDPFEQGNIPALTGTLSYHGRAIARYVDTAQGKNLELYARVDLRADFADSGLGTISGMVTDFLVSDREPDDVFRAFDGEAKRLAPLMLGSTDIGESDSGFFTGDTSMIVGLDTLRGKWGGQFYGNDAEHGDEPATVAGTFGVASEHKVILGAYGAQR